MYRPNVLIKKKKKIWIKKEVNVCELPFSVKKRVLGGIVWVVLFK